MKIWLASDLHTDAACWEPRVVPDHDVLVLAGDIANGPGAAVAELRRIQVLTGRPIIFVPGNHDVLDSTLRPPEFQGLAWPIVILRAGASIRIERVRFVGATLWTDFELNDLGEIAQRWAISSMPEFSTVRHETEDRFITPRDVGFEHNDDRASLEAALSRPHEGTTVVVTHHAPSALSIPEDSWHERWPAYASDLEAMIRRFQPTLWVHGHIHEPQDYMIDATRVLSNPRGYPGGWDQIRAWREELVIEL
ncbi:metallophosphoesterase [Devosia submarina]|uniref:metallophosphoesterase n=1 Tax=Devosia submarina TaxID=1173082 RepID=UPI001300B221|nr:metallophosphoesterase [Devosia submarina]